MTWIEFTKHGEAQRKILVDATRIVSIEEVDDTMFVALEILGSPGVWVRGTMEEVADQVNAVLAVNAEGVRSAPGSGA